MTLEKRGLEGAPPSPAGLFTIVWRDQCLQSGRPAASGGFVVELEVEPAPVELVLLVPLIVLVLVVLPVLVLGVSLRTCFMRLSQHFPELGEAALGEVVVVEVWATASPMLPASIAAAIKPIPVIRMRRILLVREEPGERSPCRLKTREAESRSLAVA